MSECSFRLSVVLVAIDMDPGWVAGCCEEIALLGSMHTVKASVTTSHGSPFGDLLTCLMVSGRTFVGLGKRSPDPTVSMGDRSESGCMHVCLRIAL